MDLTRAKEEFDKYLQEFDATDDKIKLKLAHTENVVKSAREISLRMGLQDEDMKKERLERIIDALDNATKGNVTMTAFDNSDYETARKQYEAEVKQRWGKTDAYKEYGQKTADYTKDKWQEINDGLMVIFAKFAECKQNGNTAESNEAQSLVKELQAYITKNYYTCTNEILAGLGLMYVADERFKTNIDKNGEGTAEFVHKAIENHIKS